MRSVEVSTEFDPRKRGGRQLRRPAFVTLVLGLTIVLTAGSQVAARDAGPRPATLEDLFGPTGDLFQGALTFINFESDVATQPRSGYGWGVDDMIVQWREFRLDKDQSDCEVGGSCATVDLITTNVFEADGSLEVTVHDVTPYGTRCTSTGRCTVSGASCTTDAGCAPDGGP